MDWIESDYSAETAMRFARSGALVRIVTAADACEVCRAMASRAYLPSDVPRLPIRGCTRESCRCSFVAVDPETRKTVPELVQWGARLVREGRADLARRILRRAVSLDERYEPGWLWLSAVVDDEAKIACLEKVLALNPDNEHAAAGLEALRRKDKTAQRKDEAATLATTPAPAPPAHISPVHPPPFPGPVPPQVADIREERQIILEHWRQFIEIAASTDARTLLAQGHAFLIKLDDLDRKALSLLAPEGRLDELQLQYQEWAEMTLALQETFSSHLAQSRAAPEEHAMQDAIDSLAQQLVDRQRVVREQISALGGSAQ